MSEGELTLWILFIVLHLQGSEIVKYQAFPTDDSCKQAKAEITEVIAGGFPSAEASLTCVKINKLGKLT